MILSAKLLNSDASLNSFRYVSSTDFFPGEDKTLKFQIFDQEEQIRYIPGSSAIVTFSFVKTDGTDLDKNASLNADDRSLATISLSQTETEDLVGGNVMISIDENGDGSVIYKGIAKYVLRRNADDC